MLETPTLMKRKKGKGAGTTRVDSDGCRIVRKRMTCLDSYWSTIIYMTVGVMRILVLIKLKFLEIYFRKNRKPETRCLYCQHLIHTGVNICQNMSICVRQPTYVKICSYAAFSQHMDTRVENVETREQSGIPPVMYIYGVCSAGQVTTGLRSNGVVRRHPRLLSWGNKS
jgi:hypothetical protein